VAFAIFKVIEPMRRSLLDYFFENASNDADAAFTNRKLRRRSWTYAAIARASFRFANELRSRNIGHGDRIIILAENSPEWIVAFFGAILLGVVVVPLDEQSSSDFVERVAEQTTPKLILAGLAGKDLLPGIPRLALDKLIRTTSEHSDGSFKPENISPNDLVEIVFTSGTTGEPKGIELTHENILANLEPIEAVITGYLKWEFLVHPIRILNTLPLSHVFGQVVAIFMPNLLRAEVVFQNRLSPNEIVDMIKLDRISVLACVPRVLETLRHKIERDFAREMGAREQGLSWPFRWWKFRRIHHVFGLKFFAFVTGGSTLDILTEEFWNDLAFAVVQGYGMTETAALVSLNNPFSARRGSLGQIIEGQDVKLAEDGEILVRGKNISPGAWGSERRDADSWLHTGDIGFVDETGRLYFKGRKKDVIVTAAGLNIYPEDLEAALNRQSGITESSVVSIDGPHGPEPAAALIIRQGTDINSAVTAANQSLAAFQQIRRWIIWPESDFPRTPTQKIRKNEVAEFVRNSLETGVSAPENSAFSALIAGIGGRTGVSLESRLSEDLDLDSLSRVELLSALEDRYQVDLDERAFTESSTVGDIEKMIETEAHASRELPRFSYPRWPLRRGAAWVRIAFYYLVIYPVSRILCRADVRGLENLNGLSEPVLFASNHITRGDPALIMSVMPRRFRRRLAIAMDGEMLESFRHPPADAPLITKILSYLKYWSAVTFFNAFPLPRLSGFRKSFAFAGEAMDRGYNVLIFPEGELTKDGKLQRFRSGVGILAGGLESPVVLVRIDGLWELKKQGRRYYAPPGSITITFGEPIRFSPGESPAVFAKRLENLG
jgi:long-chain acyl-CoA synthetase